MEFEYLKTEIDEDEIKRLMEKWVDAISPDFGNLIGVKEDLTTTYIYESRETFII